MKHLKLLICILVCCAAPFSLFAKANTTSIKLAIFDNPEVDSSSPLLSRDLRDSYIQGINTAIAVARSQGINITEKSFFYGNNLLNLTQQVPHVKAWQPDVIIGLNSSNASLMASSFFTDELTLSISATDKQLSNLPKNFYSLGVPDLYTTDKFVRFIGDQFPNRNLLMIVGADSKESVDVSNLTMELYKKEHPQQSVVQNLFLSDDADTLNPKTLMQRYTPGAIVWFFSIAGSYNTQINLMNKIADSLAPNKLIFITTVDNWKGRSILASTEDTKNPYKAYRLDSLFVDTSTENYKVFAKHFSKLYHSEPSDTISFITYQSVMSFVTAMKQYPAPKGLSQKEAILWSYQEALKHDPNWFRLMQLVAYEIKNHKEVYFAKIK